MSATAQAKLRNLSTGDAALMHSPAHRSGNSSGGRGLASPGPISAVEPVLLLDDDDAATGGDSKEQGEDEEDAAAADTQLIDPEYSHSSPRKPQQQAVQPSAVDEPDSSDDDDASAAAPKHYKTHLWHAVPAVWSQLSAGRALTTKLDAFLSAKAALDRSYAASLRKLNARWSSDLPVRPAAAEAKSTTAALIALRNSIDSTARNHEILADKLSEEIREKFMDEAESREELLAETEAEPQSKNACGELEQAMNTLASAKKHVKQSCTDLAAAQAQAAGLDPDDDSSASASTPSRSDWMTDLVGFTLLGKKSSSVESLRKKVAKHDAAYIAAIKAARQQRLEFDSEISQHLAAFERTELARAQSVLAVALGYTACHAACLASTLKNHQTIVTTLQSGAIDPRQDLQAFIERTLRKTRGATEPPPLPVYRRFKGHPEYDPAANAASIQQQKRALRLKQKKLAQAQAQAQQNQQKVRRSKDDSEEELSLSEATDSDNEDRSDDDVDDPEDDANEEDDETALPFSPPPQQHSSPAEQLDAEAAFTQLFSSLLRPAGSVQASTFSPVSPSSLQADLAAAVERLKTPAGRAALASVLKRTVNAAATSAPAAAAVDAPSEDLSAESGLLHPVEPLIATHSPAAVAASSVDASAPAVLTLPAASFEHLVTLCLRLLDECEASLHATPAISVLRLSRRILLQPAVQDAESLLLQDESLTPVSLLSRLRAHHATSSLRLWELSFFESLSAARLKHAPLHPWQTEKEHREQDAVSRSITAKLIRKYAEEMQTIAPASAATAAPSASVSSAAPAAATGITDDQLIGFVDKFAAMHNLDAITIADLIATVPAFARRGITQLPSITRAEERGAVALNSSSGKGKAKGMPIALPVNTAAAASAASGVSPTSSNRSDPALSPLSSPTAAAASISRHTRAAESKAEFQGEVDNLEVVDDMSGQ